MAERVFARQWHASKQAQAWRVLPEGAYAFFRADSFKAAVAFVAAVGELVGPANDSPYVDIRADGVTVLLRAFRAEYGLFQADLDLALAISTRAAKMGLTAEPAGIQSLSMIPGAPKRATIMPFWQAVLAYQPRPDSPDEDLVDPHDRLAPFWFEEMDELRRTQFRVMLSEEWGYGVEAAVDVALLGRYYERIADHAASMGRRIIYVVTGQFPEDRVWPQP